jgi:glyoxylase-like metal-dependent hydrolase (beta-lactamase superfamily II)
MPGPVLRVGGIEVMEFLDLSMAFPFDVFFPQQGAKPFEPYRQLYPASFTPDGRFQTYAQAYLVRAGGRMILVDTGVGPGPHDWLGGARGRLLEDMREKGVRPEDVDIVVFTHLHPDHVGWNLRYEDASPRPTFPRARYYVPQADWEFFAAPERVGQWGTDRTVVPLRALGALELFKGEVRLAEGVTTLPTPGHTPGHTSILLSSRGERALICGDLAHHPAQVDQTSWVPAFDTDGAQAIQTRNRILDMLEAEGLVAVFCHFPPPGFGRLVRLERKRVFRAL